MERIDLFGKTLDELKNIVAELNMPSFVAKQISDWLYKKRVFSIEQMCNISQKNRVALSEKYFVGRCAPIKEVVSKDETKKYLYKTKNGYVESVYIPEEDRATLCVSSQVGCKMNCEFCATGKQGFFGNLTVGEILNQIYSIPDFEKLTNLVYMGMGEPMDNLLNVLHSLEILTANYGLAWSPKRITVSTVGLIPGLKIFLEKSQCHLAISLHNAIPDERSVIMHVEKSYSIEKVVALLRQCDFSHQRRVSFEYILFAGKNDTVRHAQALIRMLKGLTCRVNLIYFHENENSPFLRCSEEKMNWFRDYLNENGILTTIRKSRGEDIDAACGLLSTKENKKNSSI